MTDDLLWRSHSVHFTPAMLAANRAFPFEQRWWEFMCAGLERRGVPAEDIARVTFTTGWLAGPDAEEWILTVRWTDGTGREMRVVARDPRRIWTRPGWFGWPAYHVGAMALRALG